MKQILSTLFVAVLLSMVSCKNDKAATTDAATGTENAAPAADGSTSATPTMGVTPDGAVPNPAAENAVLEETAAVPTGPTTTIEFPETTFDFGTVKEGEKVTHNYKFKNTGKEPLIISNAKGSCGCTVPEWPREPIAPGKTGEIKVIFDSAGKGSAEGAAQSKKVTLTANTDPVNTYLTIKGSVKKDAAAAKK